MKYWVIAVKTLLKMCLGIFGIVSCGLVLWLIPASVGFALSMIMEYFGGSAGAWAFTNMLSVNFDDPGYANIGCGFMFSVCVGFALLYMAVNFLLWCGDCALEVMDMIRTSDESEPT